MFSSVANIIGIWYGDRQTFNILYASPGWKCLAVNVNEPTKDDFQWDLEQKNHVKLWKGVCRFFGIRDHLKSETLRGRVSSFHLLSCGALATTAVECDSPVFCEGVGDSKIFFFFGRDVMLRFYTFEGQWLGWRVFEDMKSDLKGPLNFSGSSCSKWAEIRHAGWGAEHFWTPKVIENVNRNHRKPVCMKCCIS